MTVPTVTQKLEPRLFEDYTSLPGHFDEMVDADGAIRPHWKQFIEITAPLGPAEIDRRWKQGERQLESDGITYNPHDATGGASRPWSLDPIPLLLEAREWREIKAGLEQRAILLEMVLADLFGPQTLIKEKLLPPDLLFGHPGFHPAYHGLPAPSNRRLALYAADLARSPDGRWWVTSDRTRTPFGLGYALENRIVASRMLPVAFRRCQVERLAGFFIALRETLKEMAPRMRDNPRIVLWSRGATSRGYFEDAYLARYLGYTLVEGGDLTIRENRVMMKTLGGLLPVEVLVRRLVDEDCDPIELRGDSPFGVAGLLDAVRAGNVAVANAIGSRIAETPAIMAFLAPICRQLLGEDLTLPSVATWWCGEKEALGIVRERFDELMIRPAFQVDETPPSFPGSMPQPDRDALLARLLAKPADFIAQEIVVRSTAPSWSGSNLTPWHVALRAFMVARGNRFEALPGGLGRVSSNPESLECAMTSGERSQDVWILADGPIDDVTLLVPGDQPATLRRSGAELPSRVADNLFWMGRYAERAEALARLLRAALLRLTSENEHIPEIPFLLHLLAEQGQVEPGFVVAGLQKPLPNITEVLPEAVFSARDGASLAASIDKIVQLASLVRDRLAVDAWRVVHNIHELIQAPRDRRRVDAYDALDCVDRIVLELAALGGLAGESMTRSLGWRFLDIGRRIERSLQMAMLLRGVMGRQTDDERSLLEATLEIGDSILTYRSRYLAHVHPAAVLDLLLTDETNPRAIAYQLARIQLHVEELPKDPQVVERRPDQLYALSLLNLVRIADVHELARAEGNRHRKELDRLLARLVDHLPRLSDAISGRFLIHAGSPRHFGSIEFGSRG